nr:hypothetical protein [uncultured Desulfobulbus sp.]
MHNAPPLSTVPEQLRAQGASALGTGQKERPFILAVTRNGHMSEHVMDYALNVAHRLHYNILAVHVDTLPLFGDRGKRSKLFATAMRESERIFQAKAKSQGVVLEHHAELGKITEAIDRLCHAKKRIEFVVIDKGIRLAAVAKGSPVPVFPVITTKSGQSCKTIFHTTQGKGVFAMSTISKARHIKNCFIFGALTVGLYAAVFTHADFVMKYWAKGGIYALLPVATVFAVSYLHGNFTSSFWSALGIEASKKTAVKRSEADRKVTAPRPDTRPRAQVNA